MTVINLRHKGKGVSVTFPTATDEVSRVISELKRSYDPAGHVQITDVDSPVRNLLGYIKNADPENETDIQKLNKLAECIERMSVRQCDVFAGALDSESINGLDDVLKVAGHVDDYVILPNINSDVELGRFLVDTGYKSIPEAVRPYLDYRAIGAEYYAENGGAYGPGGYVRRKSSLEQAAEKRPALITLHLLTQNGEETMGEPYRLTLPATEEELDMAKEKIGVDYFTEAAIVKIEFGKPYLEQLIHGDCFCVEDANELALGIEDMQQRDGELLKYLAVLSVEQPENMTDALRLAMYLDDYERVTENIYEYGQEALRRIGAGDEIISAIEGYMDFGKLGVDSMIEDGVRRTEFGLIRRCSSPVPEETQGLRGMEGMSC